MLGNHLCSATVITYGYDIPLSQTHSGGNVYDVVRLN